MDKGYLSEDTRGRATHVTLTDKAWSWAGRTHDVQLPQSDAGAEALQGLLRSVLPFLQERELTLAQVFAGRTVSVAAEASAVASKVAKGRKAGKESGKAKVVKGRETGKANESSEAKVAKGSNAGKADKSGEAKARPARKPANAKVGKARKARTKFAKVDKTAGAKTQSTRNASSPRKGVAASIVPTLIDRLEEACLKLANGRRKQRVRLSDLRDDLCEVPRGELDQALLALQDAGRAVLYRDDNSAALTEADHAAALIVGEAPRHIIYLEA